MQKVTCLTYLVNIQNGLLKEKQRNLINICMNTKTKKQRKQTVNSLAKIQQLYKNKNDRQTNKTSKRTS